jgi:hypothetical protein
MLHYTVNHWNHGTKGKSRTLLEDAAIQYVTGLIKSLETTKIEIFWVDRETVRKNLIAKSEKTRTRLKSKKARTKLKSKKARTK